MKCVFCAYESDNSGGWNFCPECGANISARCYKCGADILHGARFCVMCGASMRHRQLIFDLSENLSLLIEEKDEICLKSVNSEGKTSKKIEREAVAKNIEPPPAQSVLSQPAGSGVSGIKKDERKELKIAPVTDNGKENGRSLDFNSFNQSETPDFLKNISAKYAEKHKRENDQILDNQQSGTEFLDSRSFNQSETPDFLSEIIKKGKQPPLINIKNAQSAAIKDAAIDEKTPAQTGSVVKNNEAAEIPAEKELKSSDAIDAILADTENKPSHSFDKFQAPSRIESILNEDEQKFSQNWGAPAVNKMPAKEEQSIEVSDTPADEKASPAALNAGPPAEAVTHEEKPAEIKVSRPAAGSEDHLKITIRKLIAVDSGNNRIQFVTGDSKFIGSFGTRGAGNAQFDNPQKAVVDAVGNIYVSDFSNNRIQKFTPDGQFILAFGAHGGKNGEFNYPCGLAISKEGLLFVVDSYNNRVQVFDCDGKYISKFEGAEMISDAQLDTPSDIAVDSANNIYVCDTGNNRVIKFDPKWRKLYELGIADKKMQGFDSPSAIALDADDNLVVADTGNHLIKMFDNMGGLILNFGTKGQKEGKLDSPGAVDVCDRNIYVADTWNNRIQIFSYDGVFIRSIGSYGSDPGKFNHINDIVVLGEVV